MRVPGVAFRNIDVDTDQSQGHVTISVDVDMPTSFAQVAGFGKFLFNKSSTAIYKMRKVELAMVLDVTGSMDRNGKLDAMKAAAKDVVNELISTGGSGNPSQNKIALAPYSSSVNVGSYHGAVATGASVGNDTCVIERSGAAATSDSPPSTRANVMTLADPGVAEYHYSCPDATIQPLSNDPDLLRDKIRDYAASGWTAGHIGAAWGWYLISPNWGSVWGSTPASYSDTNVIKAVLIMTDGVFNTAYKTGATSPIPDQTDQAYMDFAAICTNMKAQNIAVYTVGFALSAEPEPDRSRALNALQSCASSGEHFFDVETGADLRAAFQSVAERLSSLRVKS